jgi:hypothetical protein
MKQLFFTLLFVLPLICSAQKKETWWQKATKDDPQDEVVFKRKARSYTSPFDEAGYQIQLGGKLMLIGGAGELLGGVLFLAAQSEDQASNRNSVNIAGGIVAGVGFIIQLVGFAKLQSGGALLRKIKFTGNGLSYSF